MDDRKPPISLMLLVDRPTLTRRRSILSAKARQSFISCSAEEISEGFAIALRAMGFETEILLSDIIAQSHATSNPEDR